MHRLLGKTSAMVFATILAMGVTALPASAQDSHSPATPNSIEYLGAASIPSTAIDTSGLSGRLEDGTPHNRMGGFGSAITYSGKDHTYILVPDRGPADGATSYKNRIYVTEIKTDKGRVTFKLKSTVMLKDEDGLNFVGKASALGQTSSSSKRFDPEGVRVDSTGNIFISEEYGPSILEFFPDGSLKRRFGMPHQITIDIPAASPADELPPKNWSGRIPNKGIEGLALSTNEKKLYGIMQSSLIQDAKDEGDDRPYGTNVRIIEFNAETGQAERQFLYVLEHKKNSLCEILALSSTEFLIIERDGKPGVNSKYKRIYKIDLAMASDISSISALPPYNIPTGIIPVKKTLFIDMLNPVFGIPRQKIPEKIEGLTFGPDLKKNGKNRKLLLIAADNDFLPSVPNYIYAFAINGMRPDQNRIDP